MWGIYIYEVYDGDAGVRAFRHGGRGVGRRVGVDRPGIVLRFFFQGCEHRAYTYT